jgi:hypothetical protein
MERESSLSLSYGEACLAGLCVPRAHASLPGPGEAKKKPARQQCGGLIPVPGLEFPLNH